MVSIPHATLHPLLPYVPSSPTVSLALTQQMSPSVVPPRPSTLNQLLTVAALSGATHSPAPCVEEDTKYRKLFVGGLPWTTTSDTLRKHFEQHGPIEEAAVIFDKETGKSKGFGFVTMKDRKQAEDACKDPNPHIDGRKANVNLAYLGQKPRNNPHSTNHSSKASPGNNSPATFQPIASQPSNFLNIGGNMLALQQAVRSGAVTPSRATPSGIFNMVPPSTNIGLSSHPQSYFGFPILPPTATATASNPYATLAALQQQQQHQLAMAACFNQSMQNMNGTACNPYQQPTTAPPNYTNTPQINTNNSSENYIDLQQFSQPHTQQQQALPHPQNIPPGGLIDGNSPPLSNLVNTAFPLTMNNFTSANHSPTSVIMTHSFNQSQNAVAACHGNQSPLGGNV